MNRRHFEVGETAVTIVAEDEFFGTAQESIFRSREVLQRFIRRDPLFQMTLEPYPCPEEAPPLIARMCASAVKAGVGPMAAVAGAVAERAVLDMQAAGATQAIVDNGGDIALLLDRETSIGLYAGDLVKGIGFLCPPRAGVFGICTSSATIGPSLSFGISDAATVISADVTLADACATRLGNLLTSGEDGAMCTALDDVCSIPGIEGAVAVVGEKVAMKGRLPHLTRVTVPPGKVAKIEFSSLS
ncbi:MAG: UPF0280 family protein [Methanomassiliicoccus sp.]|nr:UPF0280 family protein [Methanomassiliicoccus sp.]